MAMAGSLLLLFACTNNKAKQTLPCYTSPDFTPHWYTLGSDSILRIHSISEFTFTDQDGKKISLDKMKGKITLVNFFFTKCGGICPKMMGNLKVIQNNFGQATGIQIFSFSATPWTDSVPVLKTYEKDHGLKNGFWSLITGDKGKIYDLARRSFFAEEDAGYNKDSSDFLHTEHVLLVDKNLHLRGLYNGTVLLDMQRMTDDIKLLLEEKE